MYIVIGIFNFPIENIEHIVPINKYNEFLYIKKIDNSSAIRYYIIILLIKLNIFYFHQKLDIKIFYI